MHVFNFRTFPKWLCQVTLLIALYLNPFGLDIFINSWNCQFFWFNDTGGILIGNTIFINSICYWSFGYPFICLFKSFLVSLVSYSFLVDFEEFPIFSEYKPHISDMYYKYNLFPVYGLNFHCLNNIFWNSSSYWLLKVISLLFSIFDICSG